MFQKLLLLGFFWILPLHVQGSILPSSNAKPIHEAFVAKYSEPSPTLIVPQQPPDPIQEKIPPQPSQDLMWIPGYWAWSEISNDFAWVCGVWRKPPPDQWWVSGSWQNHEGGWVWTRGFWSPQPRERIVYIQKAPPALIDDPVPSMPGNDYFWVPGYWEYTRKTQNYAWLSGHWEALNPDWILTPSTYIWTPKGHVFIPLHWDWPLEMRGYAYTCYGNGKPVPIKPQAMLESLFLYYPDYIDIFSYYWHFYPEWWKECSCVPPWWSWDGWWAFSWGDLWGLWWWWGHPGFVPPAWITPELSKKIAPPHWVIVDAFKKMKKTSFPYQPGQEPLLPQGPPNISDVPKPHIPSDVTPIGEVKLPSLPGKDMRTQNIQPSKPPTTTPTAFQPPQRTPVTPKPLPIQKSQTNPQIPSGPTSNFNPNKRVTS